MSYVCSIDSVLNDPSDNEVQKRHHPRRRAEREQPTGVDVTVPAGDRRADGRGFITRSVDGTRRAVNIGRQNAGGSCDSR